MRGMKILGRGTNEGDRGRHKRKRGTGEDNRQKEQKKMKHANLYIQMYACDEDSYLGSH